MTAESTPGVGLPANAATRLFAGHAPADLESPAGRGLLLARLLEDGTGEEVAWLLARCGETAVGDWVAGHAHRQLSHRSRVFWAWVLDRELAPSSPAAALLWPL